jgi:glutamate carboxypeptidase
MVSGGTNRNVIPAEANAAADVRVEKVADYGALEARLRETIKKQLIAGTKVDLTFEQRRPPLEAVPSQAPVGRHAVAVYGEIGKTLKVVDTVAGGGTDAAFAALETKNPVLERFGLQGFGAHSNDDEYILIDSIEPRLYLATRLIMDFSRGLVR